MGISDRATARNGAFAISRLPRAYDRPIRLSKPTAWLVARNPAQVLFDVDLDSGRSFKG